MLPDIQPGNTKILYFFNCLLDGMHTTLPKTKNLRKAAALFGDKRFILIKQFR